MKDKRQKTRRNEVENKEGENEEEKEFKGGRGEG